MKLNASDRKTTKILISVVIPARNEEKYIALCLQSVKSQKFDNYEIIVVDNASTDKTALIAKNFGVQVISEPILSPAQAREAGRLIAKGEILVYVDGDTLIPQDYLSRVFSFLQKHPEIGAVNNFYGFYDGNWRINFWAKILAVILPFYNRLLSIFHLPNLLFGGSFAVRKEILEKIGGFDTKLFLYGDDVELSKKIFQISEVAFLGNIFSQTSARRYLRLGILKTFFLYMKSYFGVLLRNQPSENRNQISFQAKVQSLLKNKIFLIIFFFSVIIYGVAYPGSEIFGKTIYHFKTKDKVVALTFDDGPNGKYTQEVLDILDKNQVNATFFLIGANVEKYPEIAKEIIQRGNKIGNHSFSHHWLLPFEKDKTILSEVNKTQAAIFSATGVKTDLFRPPHGWRSPWMMKTLSRAGYKVITWNDLTADEFLNKFSAETIAKRIVNSAKPGSIIDLHDGSNLSSDANRQKVIDALDTIIKEIKTKGYKFVLLNEIK